MQKASAQEALWRRSSLHPCLSSCLPSRLVGLLVESREDFPEEDLEVEWLLERQVENVYRGWKRGTYGSLLLFNDLKRESTRSMSDHSFDYWILLGRCMRKASSFQAWLLLSYPRGCPNTGSPPRICWLYTSSW